MSTSGILAPPAASSNAATAGSRRPLIATSLAPNKVERQQEAVASWIAEGFDVISVNCVDELATVRDLFPNVGFRVATRDARALAGKPLVALDCILDALRAEARPVSGIVNSDIVLARADTRPLSEMMSELTGDGLTFIKRIDLGKDEHLGVRYDSGIDAFFFGPPLLAAYPSTPYYIGLPWWDYFFAAYPILRGMPCREIADQVAFHHTHASFYDVARHWIPLAVETYAALRPLLGNQPALLRASALDAAAIKIEELYIADRGARLDQAHQEVLFAILGQAMVRLIDQGAVPHYEIREAFVMDPDWSGQEWKAVALSFALTFTAEEPVTLILASGIIGTPQLPEADARQRVEQMLAQANVSAPPHIVFASGPQQLDAQTRGYARVQWLTPRPAITDQLRGARAAQLLRTQALLVR